ncbi:hypothetical protein NECAME_16109 [Necator americanus]|uniref:Cation/H+ exchanger transmembrane domain-containing protein n=1 Tax=Necator americanus TaxID=51031 RepID=W2TXQ6_NECAM|nr:hypothetical protein NECAME_16109 [Necator americanus]ETN86845.1 hypothetical protein NECAME_16109 [Necator americanus]
MLFFLPCSTIHLFELVVTFRWEANETPYMIATWLLLAALAKILFHLFKPISNVLPDSSLLIAVGLLLGLILKESGAHITYSLDSHVFFLYLLPPIIFDAGYFMPNRALFENFDSVLLFAVVGTIWNCIAIGSSLLALSSYGIFSMEFSTTEIFVFSALISAVDPVAVIAVFEEINVNEFIFVNVFGEALFNDGVTVVSTVNKVDQLILSYGGLRGAIAFGLAISIPETIMAKKMFVTTTIVVIFFTVFLQGITIRPLVNYLNIETKEDRPVTMTESVYNKYLDYMMSGLEDIAGQQGHYSLIDNFERFNAKILQPILMRNEKKKNFDASTIVRAYQKITLEDAMNLTKLQKAEHKRISALREQELRGTYINKAFEKDLPKDNNMTVTPQGKQLEKFLSTGENVDSLYALFSDLLNRKLKELNTTRDEVSKETGDDIQDDYMREITTASNAVWFFFIRFFLNQAN